MTNMQVPKSLDQWIAVSEDNEVSELALLASKLSARARRKLLAGIEEHLGHPEIGTQDSTRVALVKLLVALAPDSWKIIRSLIQDQSGTVISEEVRFSLFCFLDELPTVTGGAGLTSEAACLVGDYLRNAKSNTASATWIAGDLLGDHWDPGEGVPILIDVLAKGRFVEGRLAALHGLEHAFENADCPDPARDAICRAIGQAASSDRSGSIRESAKRALDGESSCSDAKLSKRCRGLQR